MKELRIGLVGYGFIGRVHALGYRSIPIYYNGKPCAIRLAGVCDVSERACREAVEQCGFEIASTDPASFVRRPEFDAIDCCAVNLAHRNVVVGALEAGKHVYCEKPLAMNLAQAREMVEAARARPSLKTQVTLEYRFFPALLRARELVAQGFLGRVFSVRGEYLHSSFVDPARAVHWKVDKKVGGGGALLDIGSHVLDLVRFLAGEVAEVTATTATFTKRRPVAGKPGEFMEIEADDIGVMLLRMADGAVGTIEASKVATGATDDLKIEVRGSKGAIRFSLMEPNWLYVYDFTEPGGAYGGERGFKRIECCQRYPDIVIPTPYFGLGWIRSHFHAQYEFLRAIVEDRPCSPSFEDGLRLQELVEAGYRSAEQRRWVSLAELR
jgi:predicted dehydrogenase